MDDNRRKELGERYVAAAHGMQAGVAMELGVNDAASPKHLRVGVNSALVDGSALAKLLISKGIITEEEYLEAIAAEMEEEKARYEHRLSERFGKPVTLV